MQDDEYLNILTYGKPQGTIELKPYPKEIIDVDPKILAQMKAKLKGEDLNGLYDVSDRVIDELTLQREKKKLAKVFGSNDQIFEAYSSVKGISTIQQELEFEEVDKEILGKYALILSREANVDEVDFFSYFLFEKELKTKEKRMDLTVEPFGTVVSDYLLRHFEVLKLSKEVIFSDSKLTELFKKKELLGRFDDFLALFYGKYV
jgi:hypothetical protein